MRVRLSLDPNCCQSHRPPPQMNELSRAPPRGAAHSPGGRSHAARHAYVPPLGQSRSALRPPPANRRLLLHSGFTCELLLTNPNIDWRLFVTELLWIFSLDNLCIIMTSRWPRRCRSVHVRITAYRGRHARISNVARRRRRRSREGGKHPATPAGQWETPRCCRSRADLARTRLRQ